MGKNSKRRKGTWTPHPVDGCDTGAASTSEHDNLLSTKERKKSKKLKEDYASSLKRKKKAASKTANTPALRQLLDDSFPRTKRSLHFDQLHNDDEEEERFADLSDIVATDWRAEARMPPESSDVESASTRQDEEELYQSRKLVMRQLVMNQLSFIRQHFNPPDDQEDADDAAEDEPGLDRDGVSSVDSWQEMEERFAEIYEPIPYDVAMDSWRSMTREQMLKTVTSRRLRSRMKYMSRAEILSQIQTLKSRHNHSQPSQNQSSKNHHDNKSKSPVYEDMSGTIHSPSVKQTATNTGRLIGTAVSASVGGGTAGEKKSKKKKKVQMAKPEQQQQQQQQEELNGPSSRFDSHVYQNTSAYQGGLSLADIYQAKVEARRQELQLLKQQKAGRAGTAAGQGQNGLYVTRALVHAPPVSDDENQQRFLSRAGILSKLGTPSTAPDSGQSKSDLIAQFWRQSDYITTEYSRSLGGGGQQAKIPVRPHSCSSSSPSSSCPSDCDGCCDGGEACSMCSCSSCGSRTTVRSVPKVHANIPAKPARMSKLVKPEIRHPESKEEPIGTPEPIPLSLVKQRKMEFERLRILEEQENRLQELVRHTRSESGSPSSQSWGDLAQRARQLEDKWNRARRSSSTAASSIYEPVPASQLLSSKKEDKKLAKKRNSKKRSKVIQQLKSRMRENLAAESLDPRVRQRRHQELQELLSDAVHAGTQTLTNINLGLIYVPMEQQQLEKEKLESGKTAGPQPIGGGLMTLKTDRSQLGGSKSILSSSTEPTGKTSPSDESEDLFGSIDTLIFEPKVGGSSTIKTDELGELDEVEERIAQQFDYLNDSQYGSCHEDSSDDAKSTAGSKNGRRAAAAAVAAASPPPNPSAGPATGSCAAAASCDASASENQPDQDSLEAVSKGRSIGNGKTPGSTLDSEHYTNVDTDASWDYYPDGDGLSLDRIKLKRIGDPHLAVGNLRKKPPEWLNGQVDEADETARLLESLRMAEDSNLSTSLRLIFPPSTLKLSPAKNNIFTDVANDILNSPSLPVFHEDGLSHSSPPVQSPDSGFRSLPDMNQIRPESGAEREDNNNSRPTFPHPPPPGLRKRDTMIRELKMRLRDKFHCVGEEEDDPSSNPPHHIEPCPGRLPECKKKTKVVSKLESILASFNALAQMNAEGRVYRTVAQPLSLPAEYYTNDVDYDSSAGSCGEINEFQSTGYPHHLLQPAMIYQRSASTSEPTTIYDPSLPDDFATHYAEIPHPMEPIEIFHRQQLMDAGYPLGLDPRLRGWYDNALFDGRMDGHYPHENLYNISAPLEERSHCSRKHRKHRRRTKEPESTEEETTEEEVPVDPELTWSDIENHLFNEEEANDHFVGAGFPGRAPAQSRMAPYQDEWLFWDQLQHIQWNEADRQRWENERARRMLLWIHHSQGPNAGQAGSRPPHWWQVLDQ